MNRPRHRILFDPDQPGSSASPEAVLQQRLDALGRTLGAPGATEPPAAFLGAVAARHRSIMIKKGTLGGAGAAVIVVAAYLLIRSVAPPMPAPVNQGHEEEESFFGALRQRNAAMVDGRSSGEKGPPPSLVRPGQPLDSPEVQKVVKPD
jgi:hypothetical protein